MWIKIYGTSEIKLSKYLKKNTLYYLSDDIIIILKYNVILII